MPAQTSSVFHVALCILATTLVGCGPGGDRGLDVAPLYVLIIDAGSSGSRLRMYRTIDNGVAEICPREEDEDSFESEPGLSSYVDTPDDAGPSLDGLIKAATKYVPESHQSQTPLWIKATAGMRLVPREKLSALLDTINKHLNGADTANPFKFMDSEVLGGEEEAVFAWISMNFILGKIFGGYKKTSGILDMGGASMQVAFRPGQDIMSNEFSFYINNDRMSVYAKSYIQFGLGTAVQRAMEAFAKKAGADETTVEYPCFQEGHSELVEMTGRQVNFTGTGNPVDCEAAAQGLLFRDYACLLEPCALMGVHMPMVEPWKTYYGLANFFYIANGLGLIGWGEAKSITPKAIFDETQRFCKMTLKDAKAHSKTPWKYKRNHCFGGIYMYHILMAYGFKEDADHIIFARKLKSKSADWTMGAALYETQFMPVSLQSRDVCSAGTAQQKWEVVKPPAAPLQLAGAPVWLCAIGATSALAALAARRGRSAPTTSLIDGACHLEERE